MDGRLIFLHHARRSKASGRRVQGERSVRMGRPPQGGEDVYDSEVVGSVAEKSRRWTRGVTVLKLTQVGGMKIPRRSRERW